ncbi:hypothetical protein ONZ45_g835 [Pleurotus djamor]|nr:hypothetical protein ONZ45_g835 [Pleurotus djamor]
MDPISPTAIKQLIPLYPLVPTKAAHPVLDNPWYIVACVAFSAAGKPEAVASVYQVVLDDLKSSGYDSVGDHIALVKKLREALFKSSLAYGIPRAVLTMLTLNHAVPQSIRDVTPMLPFPPFLYEAAKRSVRHGDVAAGIAQGHLDAAHPDMGILCEAIAYGFVHSYDSVISMLETSYVLITASIFIDFPEEVRWQYVNAQRRGATIEEVKAVQQISIKVAELSGFTFRQRVPEVVAQDVV